MPNWRCCRSLSQQSCHPGSGWTTSKLSCWEPSQASTKTAKGTISQGVANGKNQKRHFTKQLWTATWRPREQSNANNSIMEKNRSGGSHRSHIWTGVRNKCKWFAQSDEGWDGSRASPRQAQQSRVLLPCPGVLWVTGTLPQAWQAHSNTPNSFLWGFPTALGTKHLQTVLAEQAQGWEDEQEDGGVHCYSVMV